MACANACVCVCARDMIITQPLKWAGAVAANWKYSDEEEEEEEEEK